MELAGSDLQIGPASKQRSRKSVSGPKSTRSFGITDAAARPESNILWGPQGRGPVNASKANLAEAFEMSGGRTKTRTLDPLIESHRGIHRELAGRTVASLSPSLISAILWELM
jgi:hypothetical protein